jgi:uncharacterized membrane protein
MFNKLENVVKDNESTRQCKVEEILGRKRWKCNIEEISNQLLIARVTHVVFVFIFIDFLIFFSHFTFYLTPLLLY